MFTTEAALQFCTGSRNTSQAGAVAAGWSHCRTGFVLEATARPDLMSEAWPPIILQPGQVYRQTTAYRISLECSRIGDERSGVSMPFRRLGCAASWLNLSPYNTAFMKITSSKNKMS
jgi:hypothetical protein